MRLILNLRKSVQENAGDYFEKAKKARKKAEGARLIIEKFKQELLKEEKKEIVKQRVQKAPLDWFEKFRWFISSEGFLCIGGRDATSNEVVIKKHTSPQDVVFHTEMPGSPFFVIKTEGKKPGEKTLQETADATATFSKAWKLGFSYAETFWVTPAQVSKQALSGEYMPKGAFMIRGKRNQMQGRINLTVGLVNGKVMAGPESALQNCKEKVKVIQGKEKPSACAKYIAKKFGVEVDDVLRVLPGGTCQIK